MIGKQAIDVQRLEIFEEHAPDGRHQGGTGKHLGLEAGTSRPEFAAGFTLGEAAPEGVHSRADHFAVVELPQFVVSRPLGNHQPQDRFHRALPEPVAHSPDLPDQAL